MKRTVSLFQFMPYGAPELLAAARPNLARALALSSALPVLLFLAALPFVPMMRVVPELPRIVPQFTVDPTPPSIVDPPDIAPAEPAVPRAADDGVPVVVPEFDAPLAEPRAGVADAPPGQGPVVPEVPSGPSSGPGTMEPDPARGVWIYTDVLPEPVIQFKPEYPELAREAGVEGLVIVHALIGVEGRVIRVELDEKRSVPLLDRTALEAAMKWRFTPALANGHPVKVWYAIPFKFVLHH